MTQSAHTFEELFDSSRESAVHLEMRDVYAIDDEAEGFEKWRRFGHRDDWDDKGSWWLPFHQMVADATARGVSVRRARIISMPATDYIRYEHAGTEANIIAGERVRWLPRRHATDLALPGNDFWLFDSRVTHVNHFTGDGRWLTEEISEDPELAKLCSSAFEAVWERGVPHEVFDL